MINKNKIIKNYRKFYLIAMFIATLLMSIGYARVESITDELVGTANLVEATGVFIYDINIDTNSPANVFDSNISIMYSTMMQSTVVLNDNRNSNLSMNITIYNKSNDDVYYDNTVYGNNFYDNNNIDFSISGLTHGQKLSKNSNVTFTMTFKYTDEYKATNPTTFTNTLNSYIGFIFKKGYSITYTDISGSGYPSLILEEDDLTVDFGSNAPSTIKVIGTTTNTEYVLGTDYTYNNGILVFESVSENLEIQDASTSSGIIYDNTTTTYDHNTLSPGTTTIFNNIAGKPKAVVDENGKVISFEYTDVGEGVVFTTGSAFDTGVDAFDSSGYTIHLKYKLDTSTNTNKMILSALHKMNGNKYNGFALFVSSATKYYLNATTSGSNLANNNQVFGSRLNNNGWNTTGGEKEYTFDMTYVPSPNKAMTVSLTPVTSGDSSYTATTSQLSYYPDTLDDISITIGGSGINTGRDMASMTVLEFSIIKN